MVLALSRRIEIRGCGNITSRLRAFNKVRHVTWEPLHGGRERLLYETVKVKARRIGDPVYWQCENYVILAKDNCKQVINSAQEREVCYSKQISKGKAIHAL